MLCGSQRFGRVHLGSGVQKTHLDRRVTVSNPVLDDMLRGQNPSRAHLHPGAHLDPLGVPTLDFNPYHLALPAHLRFTRRWRPPADH